MGLMRIFRHRRPSVKTMLGVTRAKKRIKKQLGITALLRPTRWWTNQKRRAYRKIGYESEAGRFLRHGPRTPGGCLLIIGMVLGTTIPGLLAIGLLAIGLWIRR